MAHPPRAAALTALLLLLLVPAAAHGQGERVTPPRWRVELGAALPGATYTEDGEGGGVTSAVAPLLGATATWAAGERATAELGLRVSRAPLRVETGGAERDADAAMHLDLVAGLGVALGSRVALRGGLGLSMARGDDTIVPFRDGNGSPWHLAGEAGLLVRLSRSGPFGLALTAHAMQLGGATVGDPVQEGTLTRLMAGVTYGF